jgi:MFS family permease
MPFVGAASVAMISLSNATLQLNSNPLLRGRVMALFSMALLGSTPIGGPFVGWIGENISPRVSLLVGAGAALVAAAYGWWRLAPAGTNIERSPEESALTPAGPARVTRSAVSTG